MLISARGAPGRLARRLHQQSAPARRPRASGSR